MGAWPTRGPEIEPLTFPSIAAIRLVCDDIACADSREGAAPTCFFLFLVFGGNWMERGLSTTATIGRVLTRGMRRVEDEGLSHPRWGSIEIS
jgi:hypothetical protein